MDHIENEIDKLIDEPKRLLDCLKDKKWRLNNLYLIRDRHGDICRFRMTPIQERLYDNMWFRNVVLKARQHGISTFVELYILDRAIFTPGQQCSVTADTRMHAEELFDSKVVFAWEHFDPRLRKLLNIKAKVDRRDMIKFSNGSTVMVSVSVRSGTMQLLHISEYGRISVTDPAKSKEIRLGSFKAVHHGDNDIIIVESTSEGQRGDFYDLCQEAMRLDRQVESGARKALTRNEFKFHFFPWYLEESYRIEEYKEIEIPDKLKSYFLRLKTDYGIELDEKQKAWYAVEYSQAGFDLKREHPSYPDEAFEAPVIGAYYREEMYAMRAEDRIVAELPLERAAVHTFWDLGLNDTTAIILVQFVRGYIHVVDFYENSGHALEHYIKQLVSIAKEREFVYGYHYPPHDAARRCFQSGETTISAAARYGFSFSAATPKVNSKIDSIEAVRRIMHRVRICKKYAGALAAHLDGYRKKWNDRNGCWDDRPVKSAHNNACDAMQVLAMNYSRIAHPVKTPRWRQRPAGSGARRWVY